MALFHFFTLLTNDAQYEAMRRSMATAGFDEANSIFTVLDNRGENRHEPFSAITKAVGAAQAPYVVFCHQDLLFDQGHGPAELQAALEGLTALDPQWAVAGNAGATPGYEFAMALSDHRGAHFVGTRPAKVLTLDENLLVIRRDAGLGCSSDLAGFHLYGTDLALNAYRAGRSVYVIDFHVTHAGSSLDYAALYRFARTFDRAWSGRMGPAILRAPAAVVPIAGNGLFRLLFVHSRLAVRSYNRPGRLRALSRLLGPWRSRWLPTE